MGMLDRIKKRQFDGFKEFVQSMEITGVQARVPIFTAGILEDPVYMGWVMKNLMTFDDFMKLPSDEIEAVLKLQDQMIGLLAKCMHDAPVEVKQELESTLPRFMSQFKDELAYLKDVTPQEKDSARFYIVKMARKLQMEEKISGFRWHLPPQDLFYAKVMKDGIGQIFFETGVLAAEGDHEKGKRCGHWRHNFETGKILAEGDYIDGYKTGVWVFYYGNGDIKAQGKYKSDQRNGIWKEWDRNGTMSEVEYQDGKRIG